MSALTKKAIIEYTVALAMKKPMNRITVRDIVDACGITRNTFYYYFHDIYEVIEGFFKDEIKAVQDTHTDSIEDQFIELVEFFVLHRQLFMNLYKSLGYEQFSAYVMNSMDELLVSYIRSQPNGDKIPDIDLNIICSFYEEAFFGVMVRWMRNDNRITSVELFDDYVKHMRQLFQGQLTELIQKSLNEVAENKI